MKKVLLVLLVLILGIGGYYWYQFGKAGKGGDDSKQQPLVLRKHSDIFNQSVATVMGSYFTMKEAFVDADTAKAKEACRRFIQLLDTIPMLELKGDTLNIYDAALSFQSSIRANAQSLLIQTDITEMRKDFGMVSENLNPFLRTINYEGEKIYWQFCPMAFGEDKGANWLSKTQEVINPYLGKNHPKYKADMLNCGEVKDSIMAK